MTAMTTSDEDTKTLDADRAKIILSWLREEHYGSFDHTLMRLLWRIGLRSSGVRALDVEDYDSENRRLWVRDRPDADTPLVYGEASERLVPLNQETCDILDTYLQNHRHDVTDKHRRNPLLTTKQGRPSKSTLYRHANYCTQPCQYTGECPHDKELETCEARGYSQGLQDECPSMRTVEQIRLGMIEHWQADTRLSEVVGTRADIPGERTTYKNYSPEEAAEGRRIYIEGEPLNWRASWGTVRQAVDGYLATRGRKLSKESRKVYRKEAAKFVLWCALNDIERMTQLTPKLVNEYLNWVDVLSNFDGNYYYIFHAHMIRTLIHINDRSVYCHLGMDSPTLSREPPEYPMTLTVGGEEIEVERGDQRDILANCRLSFAESE